MLEGRSYDWKVMADSDPSLSRDSLPQPYRMIWKVLDEYILDPTWLEITRLHPELLQDENGKAFCTPHNQALQNICTPSSVTEQEFTYTSIMEREGLLFMCTDNGAFVIMDPEDNSIVQSIRLEEEELPKTAEQIEAEEVAKAAATDPKAKKGAAAADEPPPKPRKATNMWISDASLAISDERLINFSVARIVEVEELPPQEEGKKKGKGAEPIEMLKVPKCNIFAVQAILGVTEGFKSSLITLSVVGEVTIPLETSQVNGISRIDVSPNGRIMCASTSLGCSVYQLPVKIDINRTKIGNVEQIAENELDVPEETEVDLKKDEEDEDSGKDAIPQLEAVLTLDSQFFGGHKVKSVTFFPLFMGNQGSSKPSSTKLPPNPEDWGASAETKDEGDQADAPKPPGSESFYHTAMAVVFEKAPEWWVVGMSGVTDLPGGVLCNDITASKLYSWNLPSSASAFSLDDDRSAVAIGTRDGSVCMWNLTTRALTSVMGRHEAAVSAICFINCQNGTNAASHYMVSGADDGTICMYHLSIPPRTGGLSGGSSDLFAPATNNAETDQAACISSKFLNFRMDVNDGTSIAHIRSISGLPWAMVSCSDGMCMVYDVPNALLLGRLALYSGMTSRQVNWKILKFEDVAVNKPPPSEEAEDVESGGKVGRNGDDVEQTEGKAEIDDPNLFIRQPPGKRPVKYSIVEEFDWGKCVLLNTVAAPSRSCYHSVYMRSNLPVLASFRAEDLIGNFYPELAQGLTKKVKTSLASVDLLQSFRRLSSEDRMDPDLAVKNMMNFNQNFMDHLDPASGQNSSRAGSSSVPRRGSTTGAKRSRQSGRQSSRSSAGGGAAITKTNLDALQDALGTEMSSTEGNPLNGSILKASYDRVVDPGSTATTSARGSRAERASRKQRLLNRLSSVGAAL